MSTSLEKHLRMDTAATERRLDHQHQHVIGQPLDRPEGPLKVTGTATYAGEWSLEDLGLPASPTLAHGVLVRSTLAKGKVTSVDRQAIESLPGVLAVITDSRLLQVPAQGTANEAPAQGPDEVVYFGQPIALVVAETFEQARHGAHHLEIGYAAADDARIDPCDDSTPIDVPDAKQLDQGDLETAMKEAEYWVDVTYTTPVQSSAPMEPHASIAVWRDPSEGDPAVGKHLTLYGSYQMLEYNRNELADSLGIEPERVRILAPYVGGGFGSKLGIAPEAVAAAIAAEQLERPVKVVLTRPQVFEATMRRTETHQRIRLAADADGTLIGIGHEARVSNLASESFSEPVAAATRFLYGGAHRQVVHEIARLNLTCAGSVRAPGEAVGMLALENAMDELAEVAGIDPIELRKRNLVEHHPESGIPYSARGLAEALDDGAERFGWHRRASEPGQTRDGQWLIGLGVASAARGHIHAEAEARVTLRPDATATVATAMTDIGTGTYAILGQIAGEMLGLDPKQITVELGDTDLPPSAGSGGSWGAGSAGSAVFLACEALREQLAERLQCDAADLRLENGLVAAHGESHTLADLLGEVEIEAKGSIEPGQASELRSQAGYGAHFAEVGVDIVTGEVQVRRMLGVFAIGRVLNEKTARSQCYGGMIFGIGGALTEELMMDPRDGHVVNRDLAEYHLPVNLDVPQLEVYFLDEQRDDWANPLQAKGVGELGISGAGAAITNAIYNATGVRVRDYPATLDKIFPHLPD